jgi:ABC-2 type transport system ATP-binding protein
MKNTAVSIKNVTKTFKLPKSKQDSIKEKFFSLFSRSEKGHDVYDALKGIDLEIEKGEFVGIVGRNGAGKSTLLKIIAEIYQPTTGKVKVNGRLVPFIELGVGFNKNLTGKDNVYLNGAMLGFTREEIDEMYDSIVDFAELKIFMNQKLRNYSSGMKVRLAFSIAIQADADILLLDEVLAVGDAAFKRKCYDYFETLKENKKTIILVSHNMAAIRKYCDRAVLIDDGVVAFDGAAVETASQYFRIFNKKLLVRSSGTATTEKQIEIESVSPIVTSKTITFTIKMKNKTDQKYNDLVVGLAVKKQNGRTVVGFNNVNSENTFDIVLKPNETKVLTYEVPNLLGTDNYVVNASVTSDQGDTSVSEDEDEGETETQDSRIIYDSKPKIAQFSIDRPGTNAPVMLPVKNK